EYQDCSNGLVADKVRNGSPISVVNNHKTLKTGLVVEAWGCGSRLAATCTMLNTSKAPYASNCGHRGRRVAMKWAQRYPSSNALWKKTRQVIHPADEPPSNGSRRLPAMGSTRKRRLLLKKMAAV